MWVESRNGEIWDGGINQIPKKIWSSSMGQRIYMGDVLKIPLNGVEHTYCQVFNKTKTEIAFFDCLTKSDNLPLEKIVNSPVVFILWVFRWCLTDGEWEKIGKANINTNIKIEHRRYQKPVLNNGQYRIYGDDHEFHPATRDECKGLELAACWTREGVEARLKNYFYKTALPKHIESDLPFYD